MENLFVRVFEAESANELSQLMNTWLDNIQAHTNDFTVMQVVQSVFKEKLIATVVIRISKFYENLIL